jgi:hypothetical protein
LEKQKILEEIVESGENVSQLQSFRLVDLYKGRRDLDQVMESLKELVLQEPQNEEYVVSFKKALEAKGASIATVAHLIEVAMHNASDPDWTHSLVAEMKKASTDLDVRIAVLEGIMDIHVNVCAVSYYVDAVNEKGGIHGVIAKLEELLGREDDGCIADALEEAIRTVSDHKTTIEWWRELAEMHPDHMHVRIRFLNAIGETARLRW